MNNSLQLQQQSSQSQKVSQEAISQPTKNQGTTKSLGSGIISGPRSDPVSSLSAQSSNKHQLKSLSSLGEIGKIRSNTILQSKQALGNTCSAFTPVFKAQNSVQRLCQQSELTNNASKSFWQVLNNESQDRRRNDLVRQISVGSAAPLPNSQADLNILNQLKSAQKQNSSDSKGSETLQGARMNTPLSVLERVSSQGFSASERMSTPSSTTLRRKLSLLAGKIDPQLHRGLLSNLGLSQMQVGFQTPHAIDLQTQLMNNSAQPSSTLAKSPQLLNYQTSIAALGQKNFANVQTPLGGSAQKEFNIPQPRFAPRASFPSQSDPYTPSGFMKQRSLSGFCESPEINLKALRGRLSGLAPPLQKTDSLIRTPTDDQGNALRQFLQGTHGPLQHVDTSLSLKLLMNSLKGPAQGVQEYESRKRVQSQKFKPTNEDPILDQQDTVKEKPVGQANSKQKSVRNTKSGPSKKPVQLVEQESELTKVTYNVDVGTNKRAVYISGLGIIDDYMASDDLNECVDALLQKRSKAAFQQHAAALENAKKSKDASKTESSGAKQNSPKVGSNPPRAAPANTESPLKDSMLDGLRGSALGVQSTSENSPEGSQQCRKSALALPPSVPRVVIRHRIKGDKKAQKRLRKNQQQNKILLIEFQKSPIWQKAKIIELQERLGLKQSQIYKWNWDMQRKLAEHKGSQDISVSAPDISDHTGRKVSDWTGDLCEVDNLMQDELADSHHNIAQSHAGAAEDKEAEDSLMSEEGEQLEVHSQAEPQNATLCL